MLPMKDQTTTLPVIICPGFHDAALTEQWVRSLPSFTRHYIVDAPCVSPWAVHQWLIQTLGNPDTVSSLPVVGIGFSAGVVGLAGALAMWQQQGGNVARLMAVDGWGMPLVGLPVCRLSHDKFTHLSTLPLDELLEALLGGAVRTGGDAKSVYFYADPPVEHLALWGNPEIVQGWQVEKGPICKDTRVRMSAAEFLRRSLRLEWNRAFNWR